MIVSVTYLLVSIAASSRAARRSSKITGFDDGVGDGDSGAIQ